MDGEDSGAGDPRVRFFEMSDELFCVADLQGHFLQLNPRWQALLGHPLEALLTRPFIDLVHPDDVASTNAEAARLAEDGSVGVFENRYRCADGSYRHLRWRSVADLDAGLIFAHAQDVTAQRRAEAALHQSELRTRAMLVASPDCVLHLTVDGRLLDAWVPDDSAALLGGELHRGERLEATLEPAASAALREVLARACAAPGRRVEQVFEAARDAAAPSTFEARVVAPSAQEAFAIVRDVTDWRRVQRELEEARARADAASRAKSAFLASMSHELRTPLNGIIGFSELLEQELFGPLNERQRSYVEHVLESGRHLLELVNDILDLSRVEAGRLSLDLRAVEVVAFCRELLDRLEPLAVAGQLELELDALDDDALELVADPLRLSQILLNLLSNAIKFTPAGGRVTLRVRREAGALALVVRDTGIGIQAHDLPRLFREFEQLELPEGEVRPAGTGLGLALTKRLVELHGGEVEVESEPGRGSSFSVRLPLRARQERVAGPPPPSDTQVLVVDDDERAAELIAEHLRAAGLRVALAHDAEQAVALAEALQPRVITLDLLMPEVDGWTALAQLKQSPTTAAIPVVIVSVLDELQRGLLLGASDYLVKPVPRDTLLAAIARQGVAPLDEVRVCILDPGNGELDRIERELGLAGCVVERVAAIDAASLARHRPDLVIVDFTGAPQHGARALEVLGELTSPPSVLALIDEDGPQPEGWRRGLQRMAIGSAGQAPERLLRLVRELLAQDTDTDTGSEES